MFTTFVRYTGGIGICGYSFIRLTWDLGMVGGGFAFVE